MHWTKKLVPPLEIYDAIEGISNYLCKCTNANVYHCWKGSENGSPDQVSVANLKMFHGASASCSNVKAFRFNPPKRSLKPSSCRNTYFVVVVEALFAGNAGPLITLTCATRN